MAIRKVQQAFKYALDPTPRQIAMLTSHAGGSRFAFNWGLDTFATALDTYQAEKEAGVKKPKGLPGHFDLCKLWTIHKDNPENNLGWVGDNFSGTYQAALRDAHAAWKNFLDSKLGRRAGRRVGRPRFKSRNRTLPSFQVHGTGLRVADHRHVNLPKIGEVRTHEKTKKLQRLLTRATEKCQDCNGTGIAPAAKLVPADPARLNRGLAILLTLNHSFTPKLLNTVFQGHPRRVYPRCKSCKGTGALSHTRIVRGNVTLNPAGRWFVSLTVETHREVPDYSGGKDKPTRRQREGGVVGIDWGTRDIATLSSGEVIENPRYLSDALAKLRRAQQDLSRKAEGSRRRKKARLRVAKLHGRVANLREDNLEKMTSGLVHRHTGIVVEGWDVQQTMQHGDAAAPKRVRRNRNRAMADTGIGAARWMIEHKAGWYGTAVHVTGTHEPTGRTCSACMTVRDKPIAPAQDMFTCPSCGHSGDRRVNTARVLVRLSKGDAPSSGESQNARGADGRPGTSRAGRPALKREARAGSKDPGKAGTPDP